MTTIKQYKTVQTVTLILCSLALTLFVNLIIQYRMLFVFNPRWVNQTESRFENIPSKFDNLKYNPQPHYLTAQLDPTLTTDMM